ncbi:MAG: endonuclease/exonuclease/phosphatase family protein [Archangium sp.]
MTNTNDRHFTAVTWNVLAQKYVFADRYPQCLPEALDATARRELLVRRMRTLEADVLCLQEVEPEVFSRLETDVFGATHTGVLALKPGRAEGCALFARKTTFDWLEHWTVKFEHGDGLALGARLQHRSAGVELAVISAHLNWEADSVAPERHRGLAQMQQLLTERLRAPKARWLFAGDFNAISQSVVLERAYASGMAESCRTQRPWDTCNINGRCRKIDYLLFSEGALDPAPAPLPALRRDTALPSLTEPSDHLALTVRFTAR